MPVRVTRSAPTGSFQGRARLLLHSAERVALLAAAALLVVAAAFACGGDEEQLSGDSAYPNESSATHSPSGIASPQGSAAAIEPVDVVPIPLGKTISSDITVVSVEKWGSGGGPWFAPDGDHYAINSQDAISVRSLGTSASRDLPVSGYVYWMPDSQSLVVGAGQGADEEVAVDVVSVDGTSRRQISTTTRPSRMQVLADGRVALARGNELHLVDPDTGVDERLNVTLDAEPFNNAGPFNDSPFSVSPDGSHVAKLTQYTHLSVTDLESGESRELTTGVLDWGAPPYRWSRDGRFLVFSSTMHSGLPTEDSGLPEVAVYDSERDTITVVARGTRRGNFAGMVLTPEGGWLIFAYYPPGTEPETHSSYQAVNIFTGTVKPLFTTGLGLSPSPDSKRIVYSRHYGASEAEKGTWVATVSY